MCRQYDSLRWRFFTLLELLAVIAIISMLASILLPALRKVREQAKQTICTNNLRQLGTGIISYAGDFSGEFPYEDLNGDGAADTSGSLGGNPSTYWGKLYYQLYVRSADSFYCPSYSLFEKVPSSNWSKSLTVGTEYEYVRYSDRRNIAKITGNKAIASDLDWNANLYLNWNYPLPYPHLNGLKVLFTDCHVSWFPSSKAYGKAWNQFGVFDN